jgi:hypothetical protein
MAFLLASGFVHESSSPKPQNIIQGSFQIFLKIRGDIRKSRCKTSINNTSGKFATDTAGFVDTSSKVSTGVSVNDTVG